VTEPDVSRQSDTVAGVERYAVPDGHPANGVGKPIGLLLKNTKASTIRAMLDEGYTVFLVARD
jgi:hypothetical protein